MMLSPRYCTLLLLFLSNSLKAQNFDIDMLRSINEKEGHFKNQFFKGAAESVTFVNIGAPVTVYLAGAVKHNKQLKKDAVYMAGAWALSSVITHSVKSLSKRCRPFDTYPFIVKRDKGGGFSMPSGHTSAAFNTATSLSLVFKKWYVVAPAYLWASSVAYARMYQGVHYPTDVIEGALVGAGSSWLCYKAQKWINKKQLKKSRS